MRCWLDPLIRDYFEELNTPVGDLLRRHGVTSRMFYSEFAARGIRPLGTSRRYMERRDRYRPAPPLPPAEEARLRARYCLP